jgi:hypothetical protein
MAYNVPDADHFEGGANLTRGADQSAGDEKLADYLRKIRTGQTTHGGATTETLTFNEPFDDANYTVSVASDTAAAVPIWANKTASSVDITTAAAGVVDVTAIHD